MDGQGAVAQVNTVCIPYRPDTVERIGNWQRTRQQWGAGWRVLLGDSDGTDFGRSQAVNRAAAEAGDWDVIVVADADLLLADPHQAATALSVARKTKGYIVCYEEFLYLDMKATERVRVGRVPVPDDAYYALTGIWGGIFAIHREPWEAVARVQGSPGAFDETITSWGGEDGRLLRRLDDEGTHKSRVFGRCYHLDHPKVASVWSGWE